MITWQQWVVIAIWTMIFPLFGLMAYEHYRQHALEG